MWRKKARDGFTFFKRSLGRARGIFTGKEERFILDGPFTIRICESEKYRWELQLNIYGPKGEVRVEKRIPSPWSRIEAFVPLTHENIDKIIRDFEETTGKLKELKEGNILP
jgi:hypothetical protein